MAYHVTTNTTNTPFSNDVLLLSLIVCATGAGTAWTITVKYKEATPKTIYSATIAVGTTNIALTDIGGAYMAGGVDIVTAGTTPGTLDVWVAAARLT